MFALKGLINLKRKTTMVLANQKGGENQKEEDQEQVKDLERNGFKGRTRTRKVAQVASRYFTASGTLVWTFGAIRSPTPTPEKKHFELRFRRKRAESQSRPSEETATLSKLVKTTPTTTPLFCHDFRSFANPPQTRPDCFFLFRALFPQKPRKKR